MLERIIAWRTWRSYPEKLRMDNCPEFISVTLATWAEEHDIELKLIQLGKPTQNSYIERFNRTYRTNILGMYMFRTLNEVRELTEDWIREYNEDRPHDSLNVLTPWEYSMKNEQAENSNYGYN